MLRQCLGPLPAIETTEKFAKALSAVLSAVSPAQNEDLVLRIEQILWLLTMRRTDSDRVWCFETV